MKTLHRHQIAWLTDAGWQAVLRREWDAPARACLAQWAARRLPIVVTRQPEHLAGETGESIAMGLPAPRRWRRRRFALVVRRSDVLYFDEFPRAELVERHLPAEAQADWRRLCGGLVACGVTARVYGSYGWRELTRLNYLHDGSDIDLWLAVADAQQADSVAALLDSWRAASPRLDGELVFSDGRAVAWREWLAWRSGRTNALLIKTLTGSSLVRAPWWRDAEAVGEADEAEMPAIASAAWLSEGARARSAGLAAGRGVAR